MHRTYKVTWIDSHGTFRERTVALEESVISPQKLDEVGRRVARRSRFGASRVLRVTACHPGGTPRDAD